MGGEWTLYRVVRTGERKGAQPMIGDKFVTWRKSWRATSEGAHSVRGFGTNTEGTWTRALDRRWARGPPKEFPFFPFYYFVF